jgi:hypothetical protein
LTADSIPDYDVDHIDSLGIPYTWYPEQNGITPGNQYNATIICNYALNYFDTMQRQATAGAQDPLHKLRALAAAKHGAPHGLCAFPVSAGSSPGMIQ